MRSALGAAKTWSWVTLGEPPQTSVTSTLQFRLPAPCPLSPVIIAIALPHPAVVPSREMRFPGEPLIQRLDPGLGRTYGYIQSSYKRVADRFYFTQVHSEWWKDLMTLPLALQSVMSWLFDLPYRGRAVVDPARSIGKLMDQELVRTLPTDCESTPRWRRP